MNIEVLHKHHPLTRPMLGLSTLPLCERMVGYLIVWIDVLTIFNLFVLPHLGRLPRLPPLPRLPACRRCNRKTRRTVQLPCGSCRFCLSCLNTWVTRCCQNPALWPIHCCNINQVPLRFVKYALTEDTIRLVKRRVAEWRCTGEILYCANSDCLIPLTGPQVGPGGRCIACHQCGGMTCIRCRNFGHVGDCLFTSGPLT